MHTFSPYIIIENSQSKLHLKESTTRKNIILFVLRFVPVVYLLLAGYLIIYERQRLPSAAVIFLAAALLIAASFMFTRKLITEVSITKMSIDVIFNIFFKQQKISYPLSLIDHFLVKRRGGKAPAYVYYAVTKAGNKKIRILKIPSVYMTKEKQSIINAKLEILTLLKVRTSKLRLLQL